MATSQKLIGLDVILRRWACRLILVKALITGEKVCNRKVADLRVPVRIRSH